MFLIDRNYQQQRLREKRENLSRNKRVSNRLEQYKRLKLTAKIGASTTTKATRSF